MEIFKHQTVTYLLKMSEDEKKVLSNFVALLDDLCDDQYTCIKCPLEKACHNPTNVQPVDYVTQIIETILTMETIGT